MSQEDLEIKVLLAEERDEEERKGGGVFLPFLQRLSEKLGLRGFAARLGTSASGGGATVGFGRSAGLAGLLATKTGLVMLIAGGSAVVAGLGIAGFQIFGSGGERLGSFGRIFEENQVGDGRAVGGAQGQAGSGSGLDYFTEANKGAIGEESGAEGGDGSATSSGDPTDSASSSSEGSAHAATDLANALAKADLGKQGVGSKFGTSSLGPFGGFAGGGASASGAGSTVGASPLSNRPASSGSARRLSRPGGRAAFGSAGRRLGTGKTAVQQAGSAMRDGRSALKLSPPSSKGPAGTTFDRGSGISGIDGAGAIPLGGLGAGGAGLSPGGFSTDVGNQTREIVPPPKVGPGGEPKITPKNVTPWQGMVYMAIGAIVISLLLLFWSGKVSAAAQAAVDPISKAAGYSQAQSLAWMAALAAGIATMMGVIIMTTWGQMMQGGLFAAVGAMLAYKSYTAAMDAGKSAKEAEKETKDLVENARQSLGKHLKLTPEEMKQLTATSGKDGVVFNYPGKPPFTVDWGVIRNVPSQTPVNPVATTPPGW